MLTFSFKAFIDRCYHLFLKRYKIHFCLAHTQTHTQGCHNTVVIVNYFNNCKCVGQGDLVWLSALIVSA